MIPSEVNIAFGQRISELRTALGISQRKLAEQVGLSSGFLSRLERGLYDPPSEAKIKALAEALKTNPDALLGLAGKASSDVTEKIVKDPEQMAEGVRLLSSLASGDFWIALAFIGILAMTLKRSQGDSEPEETPLPHRSRNLWEEQKAQEERDRNDYRKEPTLEDKRELLGQLRAVLDEWEKELQ